MVSYLEEDKILELLEESEDDERWSEEEQIMSLDDDGEIDYLSVEELSSLIFQILMKIKILLPSLYPFNKKENGSAISHANNIGRTASCNIYYDRLGP